MEVYIDQNFKNQKHKLHKILISYNTRYPNISLICYKSFWNTNITILVESIQLEFQKKMSPNPILLAKKLNIFYYKYGNFL